MQYRKSKSEKSKEYPRWVLFVIFGLFSIASAVFATWFMSKIKPVNYSIRGSPRKVPDVKAGLLENLEVLEIAGLEGTVVDVAFRPPAGDDDIVLAEEDEEGNKKAPREDLMYAVMNTGHIVEINIKDGTYNPIAATGHPENLRAGWKCANYYTEEFCGRPSVAMFDQDGLRLMVLDPYKGLFMVDVDENTTTPLLATDNDGEDFNYLHSMTISRNTGVIYITQPSLNFKRRDWRSLMLEQRTEGRLLQFDPATGVVTVLAKKLAFPTGVAVLENKNGEDESILVAEPGRARLRQFTLPRKQGGKGVLGTYMENMEILPYDMSWSTGRKTLYVSGTKRTTFFNSLTKMPVVRKMFATISTMIYDFVFSSHHMIYALEPKSGVIKRALNGAPQLVGPVKVNVNVNDDKMYVTPLSMDGIEHVRRWQT